jgi:RNA polymerase sigma-70 factor (ECF subfamily)
MAGMSIRGRTVATDVVARAEAGDEDAFRDIVRAHAADMRQVAFVVTGDVDLATEAVAAAWPIAWRKLGSLREPQALRSWLVAIAANEARHLAKRHRVRALREIAVDASVEGRIVGGSLHGRAVPVTDPLDRAAELDLANALARLDPQDRALLALRYVAGLNATELARATGLSPSGTRARLGRLVARMRTELSE